MKDITIRFLVDEDEPQLKRLYVNTMKTGFPQYSPALRTYFSTGEYLEEMLTTEIQIGAFNDEKLVGFIIANKPYGGVVFVQWIGVHKTQQNKGIGKRLLSVLENYAQTVGAHDVFLEASEDKKEYYVKQGYTVFGYNEKGWFGMSNYDLKKTLQAPQEEKFLK